jgi:hypothetical protein
MTKPRRTALDEAEQISKEFRRAFKKLGAQAMLHVTDQCEKVCCRELAALRKDKARLDWLLSSGRIVWPIGIMEHPNGRVRLDAAIKAGRRGGRR